MPIRFACPACRQPLEIDDIWGGQSVACPYCHRVVTAPQGSTWPGGDVPLAAPARPEGQQPPLPSPGFAPPPPPPGYQAPYSYASQPPVRTSSAGWALTLTLCGAVVLIVLSLAWLAAISRQVMETTGPNAAQKDVERAFTELYTKGHPPRFPGLATAALGAMLASIAGVVLAIRSLARQEPGRGMAIAACVVGALFLLCQFMLMMLLLGPQSTA
jgi:hypothetical protein